MNPNSNEYDKNGISPSTSFFAAIGKAAEEEMLKECELWELEFEEINIPEKVEAQILSITRKLEKKQLNKKRDRFIKRSAKTAAVIVLLVSMSFTVLFVNADALRSDFFGFIFQDSDAYVKVIPVESGGSIADAKKNLPSDWDGVYYPDYLPEQYEFVEVESAGEAKSITFQNDERDTLLLTQEPSDGAQILVDNEDVISGETSIQGSPAFWTSKGGETTLLWNQYSYLFMLYGPVDLDEMVQVAEHLLYIN